MILSWKGELKMNFTEFVVIIGEGIYLLFLGSFCRGNDSRNLGSNMPARVSKDNVELSRTITTLQY